MAVHIAENAVIYNNERFVICNTSTDRRKHIVL